ncbi:MULTISPECIES: hybrid sensor histidine kinase/response regulator [Marinobacter]|uniref:hybrid sensor histidine kinase/response regulator n=1 Tax=Marinobacter TaxID=2742 RepID=UPI000EB34C87|nr:MULTISPECIES: response regulator [Marinobacter]MEC9386136.1 response regulator [Pseudomonadota bacterium]MBY5937721.1 response regulator [Marinobacter nauticus]MBY5954949.1 response regulator [Marinobacter nauticus]MBY6008742.1 response regulator [Marinobacter nauticus]MCA0912724.1 response regulator [Marinobacter nauticus]
MPSNQFFKRLGLRPLALRLLGWVLLYSLILSLVATGVQMIGEFERQKSELQSSQERAAELIAGGMSTNLWVMNFSEVANSLDDMRSMPFIGYARVITTTGEEFSTGSYPEGRVITQTFPLEFNRSSFDRPQRVGELTIVSSIEQVYQDILDRALLNLLFQSIVVMLGTLGLLLIVRVALSRHLETMADYAAKLNLDALVEPLKLRRRNPSRPDELSELEQALNKMRLQILEDTRSLRQTTIQTQGERDEAIRANHAKNQFLANVSHELRIPLQSVLGYANLLTDTPLDQEQREYVNTLLNASESLSSIINDLLDISSMEAGKLELEAIPFDLRETLNDLIHMLGSRAREKGLALEVRVDENLPWALTGDPVRIRQVLLNLLSNAIKFTDSGHVLISIEVLGRKEGKVRLRLAVEDTGVGINPEDIPLVYEPYVQLGQRFQRQLPGAGLGLTICRQLVDLMGGSMDLESRPGEGSTFWVELSLQEATDGSAKVRPDSRQVQGRRVLVVDSYELSRKITLEMLSRYDVHIDAVRSAGEALTALRQAFDAGIPYDATILDGFVPDMDADLLCRQVRSNPQWAEMRLLILSSNPQRGDAEHFRQAGADAFLSKSLRESYLIPILNQLFTHDTQQERRFLTRFSLKTMADAGSRQREIPCGRMRVLLVEDNPVNRTLTRRLLEKLGCEVMTANDGQAASSLWQWHQFDVVFMDCVMPRMDGYEATRQLRAWETNHGRSRVPVVALTASAMEEDEERCREAGMDSFVAKPVNLEMLRAVLEQYCQASATS